MYNTAIIDTGSGCLRGIPLLLKRNCYISSIVYFNRWEDYLVELKQGNIHITFIRIDSPGLQGLSLSKITKTLSPATRIVFISGAEKYAVMAFEERASGYLMLPVTQQSLDEVVENIRKRDLWRWGDLK